MVKILKALALPSKFIKSFHSHSENLSRNTLSSFLFLKYLEIASSPECPNAGLPRSCARQADAITF